MRTAGLHLLGFVAALSLDAQSLSGSAATPATKPPDASAEAGATEGRTSTRLAQEIRTGLEKYTPPPAPADPILFPPVPLVSDTDTFALPKVTVKEKMPATHDHDAWLTEAAIQQKAMVAYKQSMTDLEWALNSWFIPLFTPPPSARANAAYRDAKARAEAERLHHLLIQIATLDPSVAAELTKERVRMEQAEDWRRRPAGDGRKK